jgi:alkylated DNA repair dioxygenase AlkB
MDLFNSSLNILPFDGEVEYYGPFLSVLEEKTFFDTLFNEIEWENDKAVLFGKVIHTKRKVAWYGDHPFEYTYSNSTKTAKPWSQELLELKSKVEERSGETYNSCLLNLYHSGDEGMTWHSDGEKDLKKHGAIASVSLGAERKFSFKHKASKQTLSLVLQKGSLLVMKGTTQENWLHRLPPTKKVLMPRVNLTFRTIVG